MTTKKNTHHHGNLRAALIDAGIELLQEGGPDALSIRKAAARAGVSHAAPAYHFSKLEDFKIAVVAHGFRAFSASMEEEIAGLPEESKDNARACILAACRGYIRFAQQNSSMYQLMFSSTVPRHESSELQEASSTAYGVLEHISSAITPGPTGAEGVQALIWSLVHGFTSLMLANRIDFGSNEQAIRQFEAIFPELPYRKTSSRPGRAFANVAAISE